MVILSFCGIKLKYYHEMAANYHGKSFTTLARGGKIKYRGILPQNSDPSKC